jgi:hypothetical protein
MVDELQCIVFVLSQGNTNFYRQSQRGFKISQKAVKFIMFLLLQGIICIRDLGILKDFSDESEECESTLVIAHHFTYTCCRS